MVNDDLKNREYKNVSLQGEISEKDQQIAALPRRYVEYLSDEDKNNGISIIAKDSDEAECACISLYGQHGYRRQKVRCCWHVTKAAPYLRMNKHGMLLLRISSGKTIG